MGTLSRGILSRDVKKSTDIHEPHFYIQGVMSDANVIDREHEVVDASSFGDVIENLNERAESGRPLPIVIEHRRQDFPLPIGSVVKAWQEGSKLMFKGKISNSPIGKCIQDLIREGILYGCSIGGDPLQKTVQNHDNYPYPVSHIVKMKLDELSLTGLPVNEAAVFGMAKSLNVPKTKIQKALKRLDDAVNLTKAMDEIEAVGEKKVDLDPADIERLKQSLKTIGDVMGVELGDKGAEGLAPESPGAKPEKDEKQDKGSNIPEYDLDENKKDPKNENKQYKKEISENKLQCRECELEVDADDDFDRNFCPACGSQYELDLEESSVSVKCPRCKSTHTIPKSREHEANFCPRCGQKYPAEDTDLGQELKVLRRKKSMAKEQDKREEEREEEEKDMKKAVASKKMKKEEEENEEEGAEEDLESSEEEEAEEEKKGKKREDEDEDGGEEEEEEKEDKRREEEKDEDEDDEEEKDEEDEDEDEDEEDEDGGEEEEEEEEKDEDEDDEDMDEDDEDMDEDEEDEDSGEEEEEEGEEEKDEDYEDGYEAELDMEGRPYYRCMDCDRAMYDLEDARARMEHRAECRKSLFPCPKCGHNYNFNKSKGICPIKKCRHSALRFAKSKLVETLKAYRGIHKSVARVHENLRRLGLSDTEIKKALASIAVASQPKGTKTIRHKQNPNPRAAQMPGPSGLDIAVASQPKGTKTSFSNKAAKRSVLLKNLGVEYPKSQKDAQSYDWDVFDKNFIEGSGRNVGKKGQGLDDDVEPGTRNEDITEGEQSNLQGFGNEFVQMGKGTDKLAPVLNYGKVGKAIKAMKKMESRIDEKLDRISKLVRNNSTKKSLIADAQTTSGPTAEEVQDAANRHFAEMLLGKKPS